MVPGLIVLTLCIIGLSIAIYVYSTKSNKKINELTQDKERLKNKLENSEFTIKKILEERANGSENRIVELDQRIEEKKSEIENKKNELQNIEQRLSDVQQELWDLALAVKSLNNSYQLTSEELHKAENASSQLLNMQKSLEEAIEALKPQIKELEAQLKDLSERKRLALLSQEQYKEGLYDLSVTVDELELISILEKIKKDYPSLKIDIATIEWRKIWLPKLQDLCNRIGAGNKGIYRLILKDDMNVCYVGQAVNIQDRWYQHVKKMIGVDVIGNEKLYNYRPEDFYWTIVEVNPKDINAAEHYWIEYYGCKEIGLNKKA